MEIFHQLCLSLERRFDFVDAGRQLDIKSGTVDGDRQDFAVLRARQHDLDIREIRTIFLGKDEHEIEVFRARFDHFAFVAAHTAEKIGKTLSSLSLRDDRSRCDFRGLARRQLQTTASRLD